MRELVSYDDIASQPAKTNRPLTDAPGGSPPKKRRKNNHRQGQKWNGHRPQNREDYEDKDEDETPPKKARRDYGIQEESRQLAHEEIWDDSALIHAWDAAMEEYEVLNGPEKKWKSEPVNKSPLWFNIPPETAAAAASSKSSSSSSLGPSGLVPSIPAIFLTSEGDADDEQGGGDAAPAADDPNNSHPVNFDTFIPQHDPSLSDARHDEAADDNATGAYRGVVPPPLPPHPAGMRSTQVTGMGSTQVTGMESTQVTPTEAFERAMGAWYWAGYWTGVYHSVAPRSGTSHEAEVLRSETNHEADDAMVDNTGQEEQEEEVPSELTDDDSDLLPT